jgi:hypothetical protein
VSLTHNFFKKFSDYLLYAGVMTVDSCVALSAVDKFSLITKSRLSLMELKKRKIDIKKSLVDNIFELQSTIIAGSLRCSIFFRAGGYLERASPPW